MNKRQPRPKAIFRSIASLLFLFLPLLLPAQCKYDYFKKDVLTDSVSFRTGKFKWSGKYVLKGAYAMKRIDAQLEKNSDQQTLILHLSFKNKSGQPILFIPATDSLLIRFDNGAVVSAPMITALTTLFTSGTVKATLKYQLADGLIKELSSGTKIKAIRVRGASQHYDVEAFITPLEDKFRECWK